jgi:hypothetical protein
MIAGLITFLERSRTGSIVYWYFRKDMGLIVVNGHRVSIVLCCWMPVSQAERD